MGCAGLPIGFQLIGRPWQEASLLAAARYAQPCMMLLCTSADKAGALTSMMSVAVLLRRACGRGYSCRLRVTMSCAESRSRSVTAVCTQWNCHSLRFQTL